MNLFDIILHGVRRQKGKKAFLAAAMVLCLATVLTLASFVSIQRSVLEREFDEYGANIVITPKTDDLILSYGGVSLSGIVTRLTEIPRGEIDAIRTIHEAKNIWAVSPKLIGVVAVSSSAGPVDALLVGVEFEEEGKIKAWWEIEGRFPETGGDVLLGSAAAAKLELAAGDPILIYGKTLTVSGVLKTTGSQDDGAVILRNDVAGDILGRPGAYSLVEVAALCSECPIEIIVDQIAQVMPSADVKPIRQVMEQRMRSVAQFERFTIALLAILIALCALLIFTTVTGSVVERRKEIGIFRALGYSRRHIMKTVLFESLMIGTAAGITGIAAALVVLRYFLSGWTGISAADIAAEPILFAAGFAGLLLLVLVSTIIPARRAAAVDPVQALAGF